MKIAFFEIHKGFEQKVLGLFKDHEIELHEEKLRPDTVDLAKDAEIVSVFVNSQVTKEVIDAIPSLKLITTRSMGFDHIDYKHANSKDITTMYVPSYGTRTVAEFAFALMLCVSRKIFDSYHRLLEGTNYDLSGLDGFDLNGKTLGIIGTGKIGKNVIKIAKGFAMNVIAFDAYPDQSLAKEEGFEYMELPELLSKSDVVTIHVPYNESTFHMINKDNISQFKKGAFLINTARGEIVETEALIKALQDGTIAGAGLDVLEGERDLKEEVNLLAKDKEKIKDMHSLVQDHALIDMPQVVVTPHLAFFSREAHNDILETTKQNVESFKNGNPQNLIPTK
jgi:D-lactate dehydrogenase